MSEPGRKYEVGDEVWAEEYIGGPKVRMRVADIRVTAKRPETQWLTLVRVEGEGP